MGTKSKQNEQLEQVKTANFFGFYYVDTILFTVFYSNIKFSERWCIIGCTRVHCIICLCNMRTIKYKLSRVLIKQ